jgi:hypothetical protein
MTRYCTCGPPTSAVISKPTSLDMAGTWQQHSRATGPTAVGCMYSCSWAHSPGCRWSVLGLICNSICPAAASAPCLDKPAVAELLLLLLQCSVWGEPASPKLLPAASVLVALRNCSCCCCLTHCWYSSCCTAQLNVSGRLDVLVMVTQWC